MEIELGYIRSRLKQEYGRVRLGPDTAERISSLACHILRIQDMNINPNFLSEVIKTYETLIQRLSTSTAEEIINQAAKTEEIVIANLFQKIGTPTHIFYEFLNEARRTSQKESLDFMLPKILYLKIVKFLNAKDIYFAHLKPSFHNFDNFQDPFNISLKLLLGECLGMRIFNNMTSGL